MKKFLILGLVSFLGANSAFAQDNQCTTTYRPTQDETAFAAVGSALKIADVSCIKTFLEIPKDTNSAAVTLQQGHYPLIENTQDQYVFNVLGKNGAKVSSCTFCDPLEAIVIKKDKPKTLCVLSKLKLLSCGNEEQISFNFRKERELKLGLCTPSLVYFGRAGDILHFAINDCQTISKPTLSYDLNLGDVIRFLDEQIKVHKADNLGIYYSRIEKGVLKNNDTLEEQKIKLAKSDKVNASRTSAATNVISIENKEISN